MRTNETAMVDARARDLVSLVRARLPLQIDGQDAWLSCGAALVARMVGTVEVVMTLRPLDREADALCLLRVLYEHAVTFGWLAINPSEHLPLLLKDDAEHRLAADNDERELDKAAAAHAAREQRRQKRGEQPIQKGQKAEGRGVLHSEVRAIMEARCANIVGSMPDVATRARRADDHWSARIPEECSRWTDRLSFRRMYFIYRHGSAVVHPTETGLRRVMTGRPAGPWVIRLEGSPKRGRPVGMASCILGRVLFIAAESLRWPSRDEVTAVFDRYDLAPNS